MVFAFDGGSLRGRLLQSGTQIPCIVKNCNGSERPSPSFSPSGPPDESFAPTRNPTQPPPTSPPSPSPAVCASLTEDECSQRFDCEYKSGQCRLDCDKLGKQQCIAEPICLDKSHRSDIPCFTLGKSACKNNSGCDWVRIAMGEPKVCKNKCNNAPTGP